jgi:phage terminase large subunit-like protein
MLSAFDGYPHSRDAYIYANHIAKGHMPACSEVILAAERFLSDLNSDFEFVYDPERADKVCRFIEKLPHTKGKWAAQKMQLTLEPWQKFIVCNLFGWVDTDGYRRFREALMKIPRKNGKSLLLAAVGHYMFSHDGEFGAEVYSGATTEKQAWEVFGPARLIAARTPDYSDYYGIEVNARNLNILANGSKFEPIIGNPGDGASPSCALIDEYHEHKTDDMVETMQTGMGARDQPLLLLITTAGSNIAGPCFDMEIECKKLLNGVYTNDRLFCLLYGIDEGDDWTDPEVLKKANPNYGVSISESFLLGQQEQAKRLASKQNAFKRKHLNQWVGAHTAWLNMETVSKCAETLNLDDFRGCELIIPIDLASRIDITANLKVFSKKVAEKQHYYAFCRFYLPEDAILDERNAHYQRWLNECHLIATEGNEIDFNEIQADIRADLDEFGAKEVTFDPWRATQLAQQLQADGAKVVEFRNTVANMSPAMYELEAAIESGRFHYDGNPILTWMFSNVVAKIDAKDNIYPRKQKPEQKIDGVVALIMAIGRFMAYEEQKQPMPAIEVL